MGLYFFSLAVGPWDNNDSMGIHPTTAVNFYIALCIVNLSLNRIDVGKLELTFYISELYRP